MEHTCRCRCILAYGSGSQTFLLPLRHPVLASRHISFIVHAGHVYLNFKCLCFMVWHRASLTCILLIPITFQVNRNCWRHFTGSYKPSSSCICWNCKYVYSIFLSKLKWTIMFDAVFTTLNETYTNWVFSQSENSKAGNRICLPLCMVKVF